MNQSAPSVREFYDVLAPDYLQLVACDGAEIATIIANLPKTPGRLLDIGCGAGRLAVPVAELGWQVEGLDLSPAMVRTATEHGLRRGVSDRLCLTHADFTDPSNLPPGDFDAATAIGSLFHVVDDAVLDRLLAAIAQRLRPGGLFIADMESDRSAWISEPELQSYDAQAGRMSIAKILAEVKPHGRVHVRLALRREGGPARAIELETRWSDVENFTARLRAAGFEVLGAKPDWGAAGVSGRLFIARRL